MSPIMGARTLAQLEDNCGALDFVLPEELMERLDSVSAVPLGFPHDFLRQEHVRTYIFGGAHVERKGK